MTGPSIARTFSQCYCVPESLGGTAIWQIYLYQKELHLTPGKAKPQFQVPVPKGNITFVNSISTDV
jgi:hypothetical protein